MIKNCKFFECKVGPGDECPTECSGVRSVGYHLCGCALCVNQIVVGDVKICDIALCLKERDMEE